MGTLQISSGNHRLLALAHKILRMVRVIGIGIQFFFRGMAADRAVFIDVDILAPEPDTHVLTGTLPFRLQRLHTQIQKLLQLFHSLKELIGVQVILLQFVHHGCDLVNCLTEFFVGLIETVTVFLNYGFNCRQDLFLVNLSLRNLVDDFSFNRRLRKPFPRQYCRPYPELPFCPHPLSP